MFSVGRHQRFSEWLQEEIDRRSWSQADCARAANLNRAVINKLLNGKSQPQPPTLAAIARAFKLPVEIAYRAAGLLPPSSDHDDSTQELMYIFKSIESPQRKATAITLLKALITEEENEKRNDGKGKR